MPKWTFHEQMKERTKMQAPRFLSYNCDCEVENCDVWSAVQLCDTHRPMFKDKPFSWLVAQLGSGIWPPQVKDDGSEVGKVENCA